MWKIYDDLYVGIPSGILITGCVVGKRWTSVRIDGSVGIAPTLGFGDGAAELAASFVGQPLRDTACYLRWDTLVRASVGAAALNAWYNTKTRVEGLEGTGKTPEPLEGNTAFVGGGYEGENAFPLPESPDFDKTAYARLAKYDNVLVAGEALITRALPALLDIIGESGRVVLDGPAVPATALFFAFDMPIREIRGVYQRFSETVEACALKDIPDLAPGTLPFCIRPLKIDRLHETERAASALASPYRAVKFNNYFGG